MEVGRAALTAGGSGVAWLADIQALVAVAKAPLLIGGAAVVTPGETTTVVLEGSVEGLTPGRAAE